jgi:hypothetical protein
MQDSFDLRQLDTVGSELGCVDSDGVELGSLDSDGFMDGALDVDGTGVVFAFALFAAFDFGL